MNQNIIHVWMGTEDFLSMFSKSAKITNGVVSIPCLKNVVNEKMQPLLIPDDVKVLTMSFGQKKRRHPELLEVDVIGIRLSHESFPPLNSVVPDYYAAPFDIAEDGVSEGDGVFGWFHTRSPSIASG